MEPGCARNGHQHDDGKEWVYIGDYRRVKSNLNSNVKQKEWDEKGIKELTAQVSKLRERDM